MPIDYLVCLPTLHASSNPATLVGLAHFNVSLRGFIGDSVDHLDFWGVYGLGRLYMSGSVGRRRGDRDINVDDNFMTVSP